MAGRGGGGGYEVPAGLQELLIEFTVAVLVERPSDLLAYASEYFNRMYEDRLKQPTQPSESEESMITDEDDDEPMPGKARSGQVTSPLARRRGHRGGTQEGRPRRPPWSPRRDFQGRCRPAEMRQRWDAAPPEPMSLRRASAWH